MLVLLSLLLAGDLRLELVRESLTGTHYRYRQYSGETVLVGGEVDVTIYRDGTRTESVNGVARPVRRESEGLRVRFFDAETNALLREELPFANAKPARVFNPNPVARLNDPSLLDQRDSPAAVPEEAYETVELRDVNPLGPLNGPYVSLSGDAVRGAEPLLFNRSERGFEDVNAYFHLDGSQRYLRSLGYVGNRAIADYQVDVNARAAVGDASFYVATTPGEGRLLFGLGGTDDAEDSDLLIHEYAHVIHDWISPGTFLLAFNSEARAISEGFGDYWAFSSTYEETAASGRDPFCLADWDARCEGDGCAYPPGSDCLRRVDSAKTMADYVTADVSGTEHRNGEIWSSALRELFFAAGKKATDLIVIESLFGTPPNPSFATMARRMMAADRILHGGAHHDLISAVMSRRGILTDCLAAPRGEWTFIQSPGRGVPIPDNDPNGVTLSTFLTDSRAIERLYVNVHVTHESRGDLRIVLIAPDGSETVLQNASLDRVRGVNAIYGRDAIPAQPLDRFRGRSAAGEWKLHVSDVRPLDRGEVASWSLVVQFQGDAPEPSRPLLEGKRQIIAAAAHTPGANGTYWATDLRLFNRQPREVTATVIFTPQFASAFAAVDVAVPAGQVVVLDDVVGVALQTAGGGSLEIVGDVIVAGRTYTRSEGGTFGQFVPAKSPADAVPRTAFITHVRNDERFRSNIGLTEVGGAAGSVEIVVIDATTPRILQSNFYAVPPFGHLQVPLRERSERMTVEIVVGGAARVLPYASVIDNLTGDPIFVHAEAPALSSRTLMAPVISGPGAGVASWHSDLWVTRIPGTAAPGAARLSITDEVSGATSVRDVIPPTAGTASLFEDVFLSVVNREGLGLLTASIPPGVALSSRAWTGGDEGTFGQLVTTTESGSTGSLDILYVENSRSFRTNLGLYASEPASARVTVFSSSGEALEEHEIVLQPFRLVQFPVTAAVINGRARVEVLSGRVVAYGSMVDNLSGDPIFVPAQ
jgi:subtilisin-like proprotein convertase family protein